MNFDVEPSRYKRDAGFITFSLHLIPFQTSIHYYNNLPHSLVNYHSFLSQMINSPETYPFSSHALKSGCVSPQFKPTSPFSSSSSSASSSPLPESISRAPVVQDGKIPRPLNSFMIFRLQKQKDIVEKCPGANHRDISKIISKWWKELGKTEKQWYIAEAEKRKIEHKAM
ncbi:high mobility group box domain-containing protein [Mucor lusitanicus]|uniref:High mobility group box domain-containing protein n=1 Tax=Mucor circinelloides f. lusitanicus TaxID=29924 RepID=A0A8H4F655_MUCCL|nr:high mobility group box domain-containing protein [Mucor lusitanicus]